MATTPPKNVWSGESDVLHHTEHVPQIVREGRTSQPLNHRSARAWKGNHCTHFIRSTSECAYKKDHASRKRLMWIPTRTGFSGESETVDLFKLPITLTTTRYHMPYLPRTQPTKKKTKSRSILWTCYDNSINYTIWMNERRKEVPVPVSILCVLFTPSWQPGKYSTTGADILTSQQH